MQPDIRRVGETQDLLGESPFWDERAGTLCWIDSLGGVLHRWWPATGTQERHFLPPPVGAAVPCESGAVVVALRHTLARLDLATGRLEPLADIGIDHPDVRLNDAKCDPWGQLLAGTLQRRGPGEPALGGLYRLRRGGALERLAEDIGFTNGPCFSPDGRTFYVADSLARTIWAYDYAPDGPLRGKRVFATTEAFDSGPDGATVDAQGFVWSVLPRAGAMVRLAPDGAVERRVDLPATHPTSICFGGAGLATAYVTSISRSTQLSGPLAHDGGLFAVEGLPAAGLPVHRFQALNPPAPAAPPP